MGWLRTDLFRHNKTLVVDPPFIRVSFVCCMIWGVYQILYWVC